MNARGMIRPGGQPIFPEKGIDDEGRKLVVASVMRYLQNPDNHKGFKYCVRNGEDFPVDMADELENFTAYGDANAIEDLLDHVICVGFCVLHHFLIHSTTSFLLSVAKFS